MKTGWLRFDLVVQECSKNAQLADSKAVYFCRFCSVCVREQRGGPGRNAKLPSDKITISYWLESRKIVGCSGCRDGFGRDQVGAGHNAVAASAFGLEEAFIGGGQELRLVDAIVGEASQAGTERDADGAILFP
jgi:hypothetical protein